MFRNAFFILLFLLGLSSCITSSVVVRMQRPADITIEANIKNVLIVNRSRPSKDNLTENIVFYPETTSASSDGVGRAAEYFKT